MSLLSRLAADLLGRDRRPPNAFMWNGEETPFYNRWWLKINDPATGDAYSLQIVVNNPWDVEGRHAFTGVYINFDRYSATESRNLMSMTDWPLDSLRASRERFEVEIGESSFSEAAWKGSIYDAEHDKRITFDLEIRKERSFLLSDLGVDGMFRGSFFNTLWQAPMTDCRVSGHLEIEGDPGPIELENAPAYQDTFWGPSVPDRWFWAHCNRFKEDADASLVIAAGQLEVFGVKLPRWLDSESFPVLVSLAQGGRQVFFNSVFSRAEYHFDWGRIRLDLRQRLGTWRVVYTSDFPRDALRPMDWHSPDDTNLESAMALTAPARLEIYRRTLFGPWRLATTLTTDDTAAICGGAKMDRISRRRPLLRQVFGTLAAVAYVGAFFVRGLFSSR